MSVSLSEKLLEKAVDFIVQVVSYLKPRFSELS